MRRILVVVIATLLLTPPTAAAQTASSSCVETDGDLSVAAALPASSGGTSAPASPSGISPSGGTPMASDTGLTPIPIEPSDPAPLGAAQEPTPEPEPGEPGGEPQDPTGELPVVEPPAGDTGAGGLPQTGLEVLKFVLVGVVLFLAGARLRVLIKRRRARDEPAPDESAEPAPADKRTELAPDGLPEHAPTVVAMPAHQAPEEDEGVEPLDLEEPPELEQPPEREEPAEVPGWRERTRAALAVDDGWGEVDEWEFPDRGEESPTGLLPTTALARRRASSARD